MPEANKTLLNKKKSSAFYRSIKEHLCQLAEYATFREYLGVKNAEEDVYFIKDQLNSIKYKCESFISLYNLEKFNTDRKGYGDD